MVEVFFLRFLLQYHVWLWRCYVQTASRSLSQDDGEFFWSPALTERLQREAQGFLWVSRDVGSCKNRIVHYVEVA